VAEDHPGVSGKLHVGDIEIWRIRWNTSVHGAGLRTIGLRNAESAYGGNRRRDTSRIGGNSLYQLTPIKCAIHV
jgi:hypothetical protein